MTRRKRILMRGLWHNGIAARGHPKSSLSLPAAPTQTALTRNAIMLTQDELKHQLSYNPDTGHFTWIIRKSGVRTSGIAGKTRPNGYRLITIDYVQHYVHRLAWLYTYGEWPTADVDHINRDPSDNRIANLRQVTRAQNLRNVAARSNSTTGIKGVTLQKSGKYRACICINHKKQHIGLYWTAEEAAAAYAAAASKLYGRFAYPV